MYLARCPVSDIIDFTLHASVEVNLITKKTAFRPQISLEKKQNEIIKSDYDDQGHQN